jgi:hypothetical protein
MIDFGVIGEPAFAPDITRQIMYIMEKDDSWRELNQRNLNGNSSSFPLCSKCKPARKSSIPKEFWLVLSD